MSLEGDNDDEDQQQECGRDDHPNIVGCGRAESEAVSEVNMGTGESIEISNEAHPAVEMAVVQEESQAMTVQEESKTGSSKPQERVMPQSGYPVMSDMVTGLYG